MLSCPRCGARYVDARLRACPVDGAALVRAADEAPPSSRATFEPPLRVGEMVGEYRIENRIGEGGFGVVYRAVQPLIGKKVAVKVLSRHYASGDEVIERFVAEARAVNRIRHRNIIDIFSFGVLADGRHYYVMELLEGETLDELLGRVGSLSPELAIELLRPVARALDAAHAAGIAHRDLKPENIFLAIDRDEEVYPKLLDFGIAKLFAGGAASVKTGSGVPMGTPHYMSPEQCRGRDVDQRTDIYSFGVLTFRALTGRLPFEGDEVMAVMMAQVSAAPPRPSSIEPSLPPSIDGPLLQMLAKDPEGRPGSMLQAVEALAAACGLTPTGSFVPSPALQPGSFVPSPAPQPGSFVPSPASLPPASLLVPPGPSPLAPGGASEPSASGIAMLNLSSSAAGLAPPGAAGRARHASLALGAAALVIGATGFWLGRRGDVAQAPMTTAESGGGRGEALSSLRAGGEGPAAPSAVAAGASVRVRVRATPAADVYWGERRLGGSEGGAFEVPRGTNPIKLTLKAEGYKPTELDLTPDADRELAAVLVKKPTWSPPPAPSPSPSPSPSPAASTSPSPAASTAPSSSRARPRVSRDLENPFD